MQRASRVLRRLEIPADTMSVEQLACAAWADAVGRKIAAHTTPLRMVRDRLIVEVEDDVWRYQLFALRHQILRRLTEQIGPSLVEDLEFRVAPTRRGPQRAEASTSELESQDEADRIADPVLRRLYKSARMKARA